jgi:hypothetical protein
LSIGAKRLGPEESWNMAKSTWQLSKAPTSTLERPDARAMSFCAKL